MTQTLVTPSAARSRRVLGRGRPGWSALVVLLGLTAIAPVLAVVADTWRHGWPELPPRIGPMVLTTLELMLGVGLGTLVVGCGLAWLVTAYEFPLRNIFVWLLVLPLAMPAYILGFTFLATFDAAGPVQSALRDAFGDGIAWRLDSMPGCIAVMTLTLYPYVYLLARAAFAEQAPTTYDAARVLGASRARAFRQVLLPLARPSIAAGLSLVMMEVLTDFATIQYFGVQTVSWGVYQTWNQRYDFAGSAQLASLVMLFAVAVIIGERLARGGAGFTQKGGRGAGLQANRLGPVRGLLAGAACLLTLALAMGIPVVRLVLWAVDAGNNRAVLSDPEFQRAFSNSALVALITAGVCVGLALLIGHALRLGAGRLVRAGAQLSAFGYAIPGAVIGIGTLLLFKYLDTGLERLGVEGGTGLIVTGSVLGVLFAYPVRFLGPAHQTLDASFTKVSPSLTQSALSLGAGPLRLLGRVHLPMVRPGIAVALVLVFVDAIKELPLVLMLRPIGFTTVSIWVYEGAKENLWGLVALPALVIVVLAVVPVFLLFRQVRAADRATRFSPLRSR